MQTRRAALGRGGRKIFFMERSLFLKMKGEVVGAAWAQMLLMRLNSNAVETLASVNTSECPKGDKSD